MIRAVIDTNIIISGLFWRGLPKQVFEAVIEGRFVALTSQALLDELYDALNQNKFAANFAAIEMTADRFMNRYGTIVEQVESSEVPFDVIRDPKDRAVLGCAIGGNADCIVSGDKDLLVLKSYEGIPILTAAQFLQRLEET